MEPSDSNKRSRDGDDIEESLDKKAKLDLDANERQRDIDEKECQGGKRSREEESHFLKLFTLILNTAIFIKEVDEKAIEDSIQSIINTWKTKPFSFSVVDFTKWENICGYLYRYASHGAGLARFRILNAMRNCNELEEVLKKSDLRIISQGAGPGNDAVGLCSVLSEFQTPKRLKFTLVEKFQEWSLCTQLAKVFIEVGNFGNVSDLFQRINVEFLFIQTDLPGNLKSDTNYFKELAEADVILMSKLVSSLDSSDYSKSERDIIQSLHEHVKDDAIILLIDLFKTEMWRDFDCIYTWGSNPEDVYISTAEAKERFMSDDNISSKLPIHVVRKKCQIKNEQLKNPE